jgi:hypothetical protein
LGEVLESVVSSHLRHREVALLDRLNSQTRVGVGAELERLRGRRESSFLLAREVLGRTGNWYSSALRPPLRWLGDGGPDAEGFTVAGVRARRAHPSAGGLEQ